MIRDNSILIKNIYYMLTYAFQVLRQTNYEDIELEEFDNIHDMFAAVLGKGVARQLKQGLYREYMTCDEDLSVKRGKIVIPGTIHNRLQKKQKLNCEFDELSENNIYNKILKTTALALIRQPKVKSERKEILKKSLLFFDSVDCIDPFEIRWDRIRFQKNNQQYRMLLNICNLVLEGLLLSTDKGNTRMASFLDEQRMCHLYEKFILEYYRFHHPELSPNPDQIDWDVEEGCLDFLPSMQTDITLKTTEKTLIIDAKYYGSVLQSQYDVQSIHSGNLYQIYAYVNNLKAQKYGEIAGMLLYAKTDEQVHPNNSYVISGNKITVTTLDLNVPFAAIADQLEKIAEEYFGKAIRRTG